MKNQFTISVFTEDKIGLLTRVSTVFSRRHINIESITASESELKGVHRYTIVITEEKEQVRKIVSQLEKQIDVLKAFFYRNEELVYQEIALYKVLTTSLATGKQVEQIIRNHNARILTVAKEFTIIEKTGYKEEIQDLFNELQPFRLLEFVRSGRVAITKPMKEFKDYLSEIEKAASVNNSYL